MCTKFGSDRSKRLNLYSEHTLIHFHFLDRRIDNGGYYHNYETYAMTEKLVCFNDNTLRRVSDVNECQVGLHNCLPSQRCDNTLGSYHCIRTTGCGTGYTLNAETSQCEGEIHKTNW